MGNNHSIKVDCFQNKYLTKGIWPGSKTFRSENNELMEKYLSEKFKHEATKKVLDKAIGYAAMLL